MISSINVYVRQILTFIIILMCGCTSSKLVDIWNDPVHQVLPLSKILVIAVRKDATKRRIWEDAFTSELAKHHVVATPSYSLFFDMPPYTSQVVEAVSANNFDGIMLILNLPPDTSTYHVEGYTTIEKYARYPLNDNRRARHAYRKYPFSDKDAYHASYWQIYRTYYRQIEHPGYTDTTTTDIRAIDVTTTGKDGKLIWSAMCRTPDPRLVMDVQIEIARLVLKELTKNNITAPRE